MRQRTTVDLDVNGISNLTTVSGRAGKNPTELDLV
jgi:hypothetical protein